MIYVLMLGGTLMEKSAFVRKLPPLVRRLWDAQQELVKHYAHTGLKFTLDGRLVGDLGEAVALEFFDLIPCEKRTGGVDALVRETGQTVQVKATGNSKSGPAFSPGTKVADLLLFLHLNFEEGSVTVLYNGPEAPVRLSMRSPPMRHTVVAKLDEVRKLAGQVSTSQRIPLRTYCELSAAKSST